MFNLLFDYGDRVLYWGTLAFVYGLVSCSPHVVNYGGEYGIGDSILCWCSFEPPDLMHE